MDAKNDRRTALLVGAAASIGLVAVAFGKEGFEGVVAQVATIDPQLGIGNLASFTPS